MSPEGQRRIWREASARYALAHPERIKQNRIVLTGKLYWVWRDMLKRCYNENHPHFNDYGGRGIKVCRRWRESFADFTSDMGPRPRGHSIDRYPNNDGDYELENCRWATAAQQQQNTRRTIAKKAA